MRETAVPIVNELGLHARPAAEFVKVAGRFTSEVVVRKGTVEVNGKSILGMLMLAAERGARLHIRAKGPDAEAAIAALEALVANGFEEV